MKLANGRLDDEKDKLGHLEDLTVQNSQLKEKIATMGHQIELQQKLSEQQVLRHTLKIDQRLAIRMPEGVRHFALAPAWTKEKNHS